MRCLCTHMDDEHEDGAPGAPHASACTIEDCGCLMFEGDDEFPLDGGDEDAA